MAEEKFTFGVLKAVPMGRGEETRTGMQWWALELTCTHVFRVRSRKAPTWKTMVCQKCKRNVL